MPATRRSARLASSQESSPAKQESPGTTAGSKRKSEAGASPVPKRGKKEAPKAQKTLEETMDIDKPGPTNGPDPEQQDEKHSETSAPTADAQPSTPHPREDKADHGERNGATQNGDPQTESKPPNSATPSAADASTDGVTEAESKQQNGADNDEHESGQRAKDEPKSVAQEPATAHPSTKTSANGTNNTIQEHARDEETSSAILEKGIVYFFFRGRVGIDNPSDVQDIARSYLVLRPLPHGAKLGEGPIGASENKCRLLALPKKVLPTSGKDRFMTFVEKAHTSFPELKKSFLPADDYETKTAGTRHTPPVTPIAEGVYAITTTGRENHLAYVLSIPSSLGEVQKDMGLQEQGSFIVSCKNPQYPGPSYASLPQSPDFPKEILDEFRSLRWMPLQPKHLDYENTQFLLIGESGGIDKALDVPDDKKNAGEDEPKEEIEKLEGEDEIRIKHLKGDDAIFADLGVSKKDYPQVPTTWND